MSAGVIAVYVANADSQDISVLRLDAAAGRLLPIQTLPVAGAVMPLAVSPDRRHLYAAIRSTPYTVLSLRVDPASGLLQPLGHCPLPESMASIATDRSGRTLFGASYGGHCLSLSPIDDAGRVQPATQVLPTGLNAHAVLVAPDNRHVFVSNLGADAVMQLHFDAVGRQVSTGTEPRHAARPGAGPRHLVFHPDGRFVYLLNELDATVDLLGFDAAEGTLARMQTVSTLPVGFAGKPWAADIHITPDGRFLYTCERNSNSLASFAVDARSGRLSALAHTPTEAQPRGFAIDAAGRFLVASGQRSDAVALYAVAASGGLTLLQRQAVGRNPNWVEIVTLP